MDNDTNNLVNKPAETIVPTGDNLSTDSNNLSQAVSESNISVDPNANNTGTNNGINSNDAANLNKSFIDMQKQIDELTKFNKDNDRGIDLSGYKKTDKDDEGFNPDKAEKQYLTKENIDELFEEHNKKQETLIRESDRKSKIKVYINEIFEKLSTKDLVEFKLNEINVKQKIDIYLNDHINFTKFIEDKKTLDESVKNHLINNFKLDRKSDTELNGIGSTNINNKKSTYANDIEQAKAFIKGKENDANCVELYQKAIEEIKIKHGK